MDILSTGGEHLHPPVAKVSTDFPGGYIIPPTAYRIGMSAPLPRTENLTFWILPRTAYRAREVKQIEHACQGSAIIAYRVQVA